jgi:Holliday junction resolvase
MQVIVKIPDEFADDLVRAGSDVGRLALEAWVANEYRERRLTTEQVRRLLGFATRFEVDPFLLKHEIYDYTIEDFRSDMEDQKQLLG